MGSEAQKQESNEKKEPRKVEPKFHVVFDLTSARLVEVPVRGYAEELVDALRERAQYRVTCICGPLTPRRIGLGRLWNALLHFIWIQVVLPVRLLWLRADLVHASSSFAPMLCPCPVVLTIFDILNVETTVYRRNKLAPIFLRSYSAASARRANAICTVSKVSRSAIVSFYGIDPGRIYITYNGASTRHQPQSETQVAAIRQKYGLSRPFFLFVGTFSPRKNLERLLDAFCIFRNEASIDLELILVGPRPLADHTSVTKRLQDPQIASHVRSLGFVPDEDVPGIYAACEAFAFPSLKEGFGIPIVEAMACGAPVIASNASCIPEVAGDAALYFDPNDSADIARAMKLVLQPNLRQELKQKGLERARFFTWENTAIETEKAYADALR